MYAEALNELNSTPPAPAIGYVNQLRSRAGLPALPLTLTKAEFRQAIRTERRYELAFEGHRWFDLVRYERMAWGRRMYRNPGFAALQSQLPLAQTRHTTHSAD